MLYLLHFTINCSHLKKGRQVIRKKRLPIAAAGAPVASPWFPAVRGPFILLCFYPFFRLSAPVAVHKANDALFHLIFQVAVVVDLVAVTRVKPGLYIMA